MKTGVFSRKQLTALCVMGAMFVGTLGAGTAMALAAADDQTLQTETVSLTEELGKVSSLSDLEKMNLKLYGAIDWMGYGRLEINETNRANFHNTYVNDVKVGESSDFKNTNLTAAGKHNVGLLSELDSCRIISVAYEAKADGYITVSGESLKVTASGALWNPTVSYNGRLALSVTKNDADNKITPDSTTWNYYDPGKTYFPEDTTVEVKAGDTVYLNMRAERLNSSEVHCYVSFEYSPVFTYSATAPESGEEIDYDNVVLTEDLARIKSLSDLKNTALTYYTENSWAGYTRVQISEEKKAEHPQAYLNGVMINNASDLELVNLRSSGLHTVGIWNENVNRVVSIGYTARKSGYILIPEAPLSVVSDAEEGKEKSSNGRLGMIVTLNDTKTMPDTIGWEYYEAGKDYTVPAQAFQVSEGDTIYISFISDKLSVSETFRSYVSFRYDPSFVYSEDDPIQSSSVHSFSHADKLTINNSGELVNDVQITDDDQTTYPFSYLYRLTAGSASGYPGTEDSTGIVEMAPNSGLGANNIYAAGSYSGFQAGSGSIITVAVVPDPYNVILGFTAPYDGELTISDIAFNYRRDWYQALVNKNWKPSSGRELVDPENPGFNYENFYDLCEGFTYGDPDGNGKDDTIGYGLNKDEGIYWWYPLLNMFNVQSEGWEYNEATGRWEPEILSDRAKQAVMWIADMYDRGFINSNYNTTTTYEMAKSDFCSGKTGIITYNAIPTVPEGTLEMMTQFLGKVAGSKTMGDVVRGMPVVTGIDGVKRVQGAVNNYGYLAINNDISENKKRKILSSDISDRTTGLVPSFSNSLPDCALPECFSRFLWPVVFLSYCFSLKCFSLALPELILIIHHFIGGLQTISD